VEHLSKKRFEKRPGSSCHGKEDSHSDNSRQRANGTAKKREDVKDKIRKGGERPGRRLGKNERYLAAETKNLMQNEERPPKRKLHQDPRQQKDGGQRGFHPSKTVLLKKRFFTGPFQPGQGKKKGERRKKRRKLDQKIKGARLPGEPVGGG